MPDNPVDMVKEVLDSGNAVSIWITKSYCPNCNTFQGYITGYDFPKKCVWIKIWCDKPVGAQYPLTDDYRQIKDYLLKNVPQFDDQVKLAWLFTLYKKSDGSLHTTFDGVINDLKAKHQDVKKVYLEEYARLKTEIASNPTHNRMTTVMMTRLAFQKSFSYYIEDVCFKDFNVVQETPSQSDTQNSETFTVKFLSPDGAQIGTDQRVAKGGTAVPPDTEIFHTDVKTFWKWDNSYQNIQADTTCRAVLKYTSHRVLKKLDRDNTVFAYTV